MIRAKRSILVILLLTSSLIALVYSKKPEPLSSTEKIDTKSSEFRNNAIQLNKLAESLINKNADSALTLINLSIKISEENSLDEMLGNAILIKGMIYKQKGDFDSFIKYLNSSIDVFSKSNNPAGKSKAFSQLGFAYFRKGDFPSAINYYTQALKIDEETNNLSKAAKDYSQMGQVYVRDGQYQKGLEHHLLALSIIEKTNEKSGIYDIYINIGTAYFNLKNYDKAIEYHNKSLDYGKTANDKAIIATALGNLGNVYYEKEDYLKAKEYYSESLKYFKELKSGNSIAVAYLNIGQSDIKICKSKDNALTDSSKSILMKESFDYLNKSLELFTKTKNNDGLRYLHLGFTEYYEANKQFEKALESYRKARDLQDSIFSIDNKVKIENLESRRKLEVKEKENLLLTKDLQLKNVDLIRKNQQIELLNTKEKLNSLMITQKNDSLDIYEKDQILKDLTIKQQEIEEKSILQEKEQLAILKDKEESTSRLYKTILIMAIALIVAIFYFLRRKSKDNKALNEKNILIENTVKELNEQNAIIQDQKIEVEFLNEDLVERERQLTLSNKSKEKLFSIISHDLMSPVNSFYSLSTILKNKKENQIDIQDYLVTNTMDTAFKIKVITENLLNWSRMQMNRYTINYDDFNLNRLVEEVIYQCSSFAEKKNIKITTSQVETKVSADRYALEIALRNVLMNAIKFTPIDGKIDIEIISNSEFVTVSIADNGEGFTSDLIEKFNNSEAIQSNLGTADEKGTGLGLFLIKEIIERHEGSIKLSNSIKGGAKVEINLIND